MKVAAPFLSALLARRTLAVLVLGFPTLIVLVAIGSGLRGRAQDSTRSALMGTRSAAPRERVQALMAPSAPAAVAENSVVVEDAAVASGPTDNAGTRGAFETAEASITRQIITTGEVTIEVDDVEASTRSLESIVAKAGGWIAHREASRDEEGRRKASLVVRFPSSGFATIHDALAGLGDVTHDAIRTQDVGREFVDLEARHHNLLREEGVIRELFERKGKIGEVLAVERELARVPGEIEQIEGQLRYLRNQVSYSTLAISLAPKRPAIQSKVESWSLGYHAVRATRMLLGTARSMATALLYVVIVIGPFALVIAAVGLVLHRARRRWIATP
jgi:hypothetical protein